MTKDLAEKHGHVFFDNYFISVKLMKTLQAKSIWACGTIRTNRKGNPQNIKTDKSLQR